MCATLAGEAGIDTLSNVSRLTGKRALLEQLIADGVTHIFGNPGTTEQGFMDILQDYPQVQFMLALHEGVAVCDGRRVRAADASAGVRRSPHRARAWATRWA